MSAPGFRAAHGSGDTWSAAAAACVEALQPLPDGANLGFVYATEALAGDLDAILALLRERTRVAHWVGSVGLGVCGSGKEYFEEPALSVLVAPLPDESFRVFGPEIAGADALGASDRAWFQAAHPDFGVVHGDPRDGRLPVKLAELSSAAGLYLVGGIAAAMNTAPVQVAERVVEGGLSGVVLAPRVAVATGLTQGCAPIGPVHRVTAARENIVIEIDDRPALEVFKADIGELLARDLRRVAGSIFVGLPVRGSDTGDYLVRNLIAIDVERQWLGIADRAAPGDPILFCRRDAASAAADLKHMLGGLKRRAGGAPRAGLYFSCVARGPNLFGPNSEELGMIRATLGDLPLAGFFGNGEIAHDRLYGYTGVLALFL